MINIPTELLRTLVAVVDLRSFTKAAQSLGVTQPAVSAQIKRLQTLLDCELFDKSAPGVSLTPSGEVVVHSARRLLAINDQIVDMSVPRIAPRTIRIGTPGDYVAPLLPSLIQEFRARHPGMRVSVRSEHFDNMARDLRHGELDLLVGLSEPGILLNAHRQWAEPVVWVRSPEFELDSGEPVPLVTFGETWSLHRASVSALNRMRRPFEVVFSAPSDESVASALRNGLGVAALLRSRVPAGLEIWEKPPLPYLPDLMGGIYLGANGEQTILETLADRIFGLIQPRLGPSLETPEFDSSGLTA